ncbi:TetR/AcrR family transcriptional regulator [Paenibacillus thermotolerans]|uniref:TetR/AcrR family transcriptional regulator n=1 Tax=Paenibacillus thermotolerans TaxID=3027807 RepID=UPI0023676D1D|nr:MULTISPECIES: TetR/AcrR family transcriptional regulator [unclassified Paenibacillus]
MAPRPGLDTNKVVLAAAELADERGFHQVTLALLADKLKVRTPSLYNHIGGLPELQMRLALMGIEQLRQTIVEAAVGKTGKAALLDVGVAYVQYVRRRPGLYEAVNAAARMKDEEIQAASAKIVDVIIKVMSITTMEHKDIIHAVRGLRSIVHGFALLDMAGGFGIPIDPDESLRKILNTYLDGLFG